MHAIVGLVPAARMGASETPAHLVASRLHGLRTASTGDLPGCTACIIGASCGGGGGKGGGGVQGQSRSRRQARRSRHVPALAALPALLVLRTHDAVAQQPGILGPAVCKCRRSFAGGSG
ncbi:hypothetical protein Purlil1_11857 [Purpureocillium lilacinum]|uniref:Uncharacterized protein n=1 Tax=Purpureocillium lilacinum TaxID=33203 RepID=A0ABR0BII4_PURLI|nr:hypothetical protein Purlil1_11857 [Purpureocillium lilacinum]